MAKVFAPKVVSANRLRDGLVVFYTASGEWVEGFANSAVYTTPEAEAAALAKAVADIAANKVVDVYSFDVAGEGASLKALALRDAIRAAGPTIVPLMTP